MKDLKSRFIELKDTDKYLRVASSHPIAWYVGLDGRNRYSLFAITKTQPKNISETKLMSVFVGERRDGNYGITFSLLEKRNLDLFAHFCEDMITYTKHITKAEVAADGSVTDIFNGRKHSLKRRENCSPMNKSRG